MYVITYYKIANRWFLDDSDYLDRGGHPDDLERIGAFHEFLEIAAAGESSIIFQMSPEPFEGADVMYLTGSSGENTGGYYHLKLFEGRTVDLELWMNVLFYHQQAELPKVIYLKRYYSSIS